MLLRQISIIIYFLFDILKLDQLNHNWLTVWQTAGNAWTKTI